MTNVLYIGNALSEKGKTSTTIDTLSKKLSEFCSVKVASNKSNKVIRLLDMVWTVFKNRNKTDFVLIDTYSTSNWYYALIVSQVCRFLKIKYIPILHGGNLEKRLANNKKLSGLIFNNAHKLVAPSKFLESVFSKYGYNNLVFIPNTIDIENYKFKQRELSQLKLLWVRSFSSIYNPEMAIKVLERLNNNGVSAMLTMVGPEIDGSMASTKELARHKKLDVEFTGKLTKEEWIRLSEGHNIFINTTNIDNTPVSVIEAMALGIPIVSTNVGGIPFLVSNGEEGLLVERGSSNAMCDSILKLYKNNDLKKTLTNNARQKVEAFDWNLVKPKWQLLLQ